MTLGSAKRKGKTLKSGFHEKSRLQRPFHTLKLACKASKISFRSVAGQAGDQKALMQ